MLMVFPCCHTGIWKWIRVSIGLLGSMSDQTDEKN